MDIVPSCCQIELGTMKSMDRISTTRLGKGKNQGRDQQSSKLIVISFTYDPIPEIHNLTCCTLLHSFDITPCHDSREIGSPQGIQK